MSEPLHQLVIMYMAPILTMGIIVLYCSRDRPHVVSRYELSHYLY